jgi:hypothetical protein
MKGHTYRVLPSALAAVALLGACGGTDDVAEPPSIPASSSDLRAPTPIAVTAGGTVADQAADASADGALAADEMTIAPFYDVEYLLGDGLVAPSDDAGYVYDPTVGLSAEQVAALASALGVAGEPVRADDGPTGSWRVGPDDGSAPSLWVSGDGQQWWNYSSAWDDQAIAREACAVSVDSAGEETIEECPEPDPPAGVPTAEEAERRAAELLTAIGVDLTTVVLETYADEWFAGVTANDTSDPRAAIRSWSFGFGAEGALQYAGGSLATPVPVGPYPLVDITTAFERLRDRAFGGVAGGPAVDLPAIAEAEVAADAVGGSTPAATEVPTIETLPVAPPPAETLPGGGSIPPFETTTVTLVDVQADLWWAWDADGAVWLVPAFRFIGDDGGWYTVPAVTDEYLVQVDPPVVTDEPPPVEPDDGSGDSGGVGSSEPGPAVGDDAVLGRPLDVFTAAAEALGYVVRVVAIDGEGLAVTEDFVENRINVSVVTEDGVEIVVAAVSDAGIEIDEIVGNRPAIGPEDLDAAAIEVELHAELDGVLPLPLEEFTDRAGSLGFDTRVVIADGERLEVTADFSFQRVNVEVADGRVVAILSVG